MTDDVRLKADYSSEVSAEQVAKVSSLVAPEFAIGNWVDVEPSRVTNVLIFKSPGERLAAMPDLPCDCEPYTAPDTDPA